MVFLAMTTLQGEQPSASSDDISLESLRKELEQLQMKLSDARCPPKESTALELCNGVECLSALNMRSRRHIQGNTGKILSITWSPDGRTFACTNDGGRLSLWDGFLPDQIIGNHVSKEALLSCQFSPSGDSLVCGGNDNKCSIVSLKYENKTDPPLISKRAVGMHTGFVSCCKFNHADEKQVLTSSGDGTCCLWDVECNEQIHAYRGHCQEVLGLDLAPMESGHIFVSGGADQLAMVWDTRQASPVQCFSGHERDINCVRYMPTGDAFVTASDDTTCRLFDRRAEKEIHCYTKPSILFPCNSVEFSNSGRLLFGGYGDNVLHVWDTLKATREAMLMGHESSVSCVKLSPDGMAVASSSWDGSIRVWA